MRIRPLCEADAVSASALCTELGYPTSPEDLRRRLAMLLAMPGQALLGAEGAGQLVGWMHVQSRYVLEVEPFAEICALVVAQAYRGRRAGQALVEAAEAWAQREGHARICVRSNVESTGNHGHAE